MKTPHTLLMLVFTLFSISLFAQTRQSGLNLVRDSHILNVPENTKWLQKEGRKNPMSALKGVYYYEGFESPTSGGVLPNGWTQSRTTTLNTQPVASAAAPRWFINSVNFGFEDWQEYVYSGGASMTIGYSAPSYTWAITPEFSIGNPERDVTLSYWVWVANNSEQNWLTNYHVKIKSDGVWTNLLSYFGSGTNSNLYEKQVIINLNAYKGKSVQLAFIYEFTDGFELAIDDILVAEDLENDFGVEDLFVVPGFGLRPGDTAYFGADVFSNGSNNGAVELSFFVNGVLQEKATTQVLTRGGDSEFIYFEWIAPVFGYYDIQLVLPDDEYAGNNTLGYRVYVNHYYKLVEDFENFVFDELGNVELVFPPSGWTLNDPNWVTATTQWPSFEDVSALLHGRTGLSEKALYTRAVDLTNNDKWIRFYLEGVNNNITINDPTANPPGIQGYSTFQLKYAQNPEGPWTNIGAPEEFINKYDQNGLIQAANALRKVQYDISHLNGTYYFAFTTTSNFSLIYDNFSYRSFVIVDNIMIGADPGDVTFNVKDNKEAGLSGVVIQVFDEDNDLYASFTSGENGTLNTGLPIGNFTYKATKLGYNLAEGLFSVTTDLSLVTVNITMTAPEQLFNVTFNILNEEQNPFGGVNVEISSVSFMGLSDLQGKLIIEGFAPGTYNYSLSAQNYFTRNASFEVVDADFIVDIEMSIDNTSVDEIVLNDFRLFPNPATNIVVIQSEQIINQVEVFSLLGKRVYFVQSFDTKHTIDTSGFNRGIYLVRVATNKGVISKRLIVTN